MNKDFEMLEDRRRVRRMRRCVRGESMSRAVSPRSVRQTESRSRAVSPRSVRQTESLLHLAAATTAPDMGPPLVQFLCQARILIIKPKP